MSSPLATSASLLDAVKLHKCQHLCFLEFSKTLSSSFSHHPESVRIAPLVSRIFVTYATAWWPINCSTSSLSSKLGPPTTSHASLLLRPPRRQSVQARQHNVQPHVVLHALFLQLCDGLITETTAIVHDVASPGLALPIIVGRAPAASALASAARLRNS